MLPTAISSCAPIRRGGTIAMELMLNLPIWLLALLAMVELGEILCAAQHVSFCARVGAAEASRIAQLASAREVPSGVVEAVRRQLAASGMSPTRIILEHNVGQRFAMLTWGERPLIPRGTRLPKQGTYVRVTVAARLERFVPRLFRKLGVDIASQCLVDSAVFRHAGDGKEAG